MIPTESEFKGEIVFSKTVTSMTMFTFLKKDDLGANLNVGKNPLD